MSRNWGFRGGATYQDEDLNTDGFKGADLLGAVVGVLDAELEGSFTVVQQLVPVSYG
jgi:hypothetical protein